VSLSPCRVWEKNCPTPHEDQQGEPVNGVTTYLGIEKLKFKENMTENVLFAQPEQGLGIILYTGVF
jgi:hypothetical protein